MGDATRLVASSALANVCTLVGEKNYVRSFLDERYLWYREITNVVAANYSTVPDYFYALRVTTPDANKLPKDQFSFVLSTTDADSLSTGVNVGYGIVWQFDALERRRVAHVEPGSPAANAGMARGGVMDYVIGRNVSSWYPNQAGAYTHFNYRDTPASTAREILLYANTVQDNAVPQVSVLSSKKGKKVGYILFNDHAEGAQDKLIPAIQSFKTQNVEELVLDMRYNTGGYLYVAETLASMVAGPSANGQVFEKLQFSDKRTADTMTSLFEPSVQYMESVYARGYVRPKLNLKRVYMLTSDQTCSASESVVNGLRGIGIEVILVGTTTCGKPYGFRRQDNCQRAYFAIEFKGTNAKGFGDYSAGFSPTCRVQDDLDHPLGQSTEAQLSAALDHIDTGNCPAAPSQALLYEARSASSRSNNLVAREALPIPHGKLLTPTRR